MSQIFIEQGNILQSRAFEYVIIYQMGVLKQVNPSALFYSAVDYISKRLNIPLPSFLYLLSKRLDLDKLDAHIKSLLIALMDQQELRALNEPEKIYREQSAFNKNQLLTVLEERNRLFPSKYLKKNYLHLVIQYLEKGILENIFDLMDPYKSKFEFLIYSKSEKLIEYLSSTAFLKAKIKVERLATLSNSLSLEQISKWLDIDTETQGVIEDLRKIFSNKEFKVTLSSYEGARFSPSFFNKAILVALLETRKQPKAGSVFIDTFLQQYVDTGAVERNELLFELYRLGEKKTYKRVSNRLFDLLFSVPTPVIDIPGKAEQIKDGEVDQNLPKEIISKFDKVPKMSAQNQLSFLLEVFYQLQEPSKKLAQFYFPQTFLASLEASTLERFFKQIKTQIDFSVLPLIEELIQQQAVKVSKKELLLIYQSSFILLMTKQRPLRADQFKNELINHLFKNLRCIFK